MPPTLIASLCLIVVAGGGTPASDDVTDSAGPIPLSETAVEEARARFSFGGEPIHPGLVEEFIGWLSDSGPITASVDVAAAADTNEYWDEAVRRHNDWLSIEREGDRGYFSYRRLGKLADGTQVLHTADNGGGSGVFHELVLVRFHTDWARRHDGRTYERLLMTVVATRVLGDRPDPLPDIEVGDNAVAIRAASADDVYLLRPPPLVVPPSTQPIE